MCSVNQELWVLGNGPSLRDLDFSTLTGKATLGMNAAYRFWRRIDWRPSIYSCLDDALIDTHSEAIKSFIDEGRIERFFLTARILDYYPSLIEDERIRYLDEFVMHWHQVRGAEKGLQFERHAAFKTRSPDMLTTGAYSVRFGATLGYRSVRLLGIDLTYQALDQATSIGGNGLVMDATPKKNPNYFFDDYQLAGDRFNIANPEGHGRELHLHSFISLRDDFIEHAVPTRVINSSIRSKLFSEAIIPFHPLDSPIGGADISEETTIILSVTNGDALANLLWLWTQPAFFPFLGTPTPPAVDLIFEVNPTESPSIERQIAKHMKRNPALRNCFRGVHVRTSQTQSVALDPQVEKFQRVHLLDDQMVPIHCDWLGSLLANDADANPRIELSIDANSVDDFTALRARSGKSLFLRDTRATARLANVRRTSEKSRIASLPAMLEWGEPGGGTQKRRTRGRTLSILTFWRA